jgi:hypothetical protein
MKLFTYLALGGCAAVTLAAGGDRPADQKLTGTEVQLSRAVNLVLTDDGSREAEHLLLNIIAKQPLATRTGETARYYLARYYHRNYYMLRQRDALPRAISRYTEIHTGIEKAKAPSRWYGESRFYRTLAHLEQGRWRDGLDTIDRMIPTVDRTVEIDYLVWSVPRRTIGHAFPADTLKARTIEILKANGVTPATPDGVNPKRFDAIVRGLQGALDALRRRTAVEGDAWWPIPAAGPRDRPSTASPPAASGEQPRPTLRVPEPRQRTARPRRRARRLPGGRGSCAPRSARAPHRDPLGGHRGCRRGFGSLVPPQLGSPP